MHKFEFFPSFYRIKISKISNIYTTAIFTVEFGMYNAFIFGLFQINSLLRIKSEEGGFSLAALAKSGTAVLEVKVRLSDQLSHSPQKRKIARRYKS
jgi:hypothetical protein